MWRRFTLNDVRVIGHYLGVLVVLAGLMMGVPFIVALALQEWEPASRYFFSGAIALAAGGALRLLKVHPSRLTRREALAVTGLAWIVLALFCSIPLSLSGHYLNYTDALFDGVSGLTTTGASVIMDLDHLSMADNMFRFMMHFVGGLGIIVIGLSIGVFGRRSGGSLFSSEARSEYLLPNVVHTARFITRISLGIIGGVALILILLCLFAEMDPIRAFFHGIWLAISGFLTGGFTPMSQSIGYYHSFTLEMVLMVVMILGAISFIIFVEVFRGRISTFFKDIEIHTMVIWMIFITVVFIAALAGSLYFSDLPALLRRGLFMEVAAFTTTGFQTVTNNQMITVFSSGAFLTLAIMMAVGGSADSTAGGIKLRRLGLIGKSFVSTIKEALSPESARVVVDYHHIGRRVLSPEIVKSAMTIIIMYMISYVIGTLVGVAFGYDAVQSIFESVAMTSNGGLISNIVAPGMPDALQLFYMLQMWLGRLEFVTLIALVTEIVVSFIPRRKVRG